MSSYIDMPLTERTLWYRWIAANTVGLSLGLALGIHLTGIIARATRANEPFNDIGFDIPGMLADLVVMGASTGILLGLMQGLVIRRYMQSQRWILATFLVLSFVMPLALLVGLFLGGGILMPLGPLFLWDRLAGSAELYYVYSAIIHGAVNGAIAGAITGYVLGHTQRTILRQQGFMAARWVRFNTLAASLVGAIIISLADVITPLLVYNPSLSPWFKSGAELAGILLFFGPAIASVLAGPIGGAITGRELMRLLRDRSAQ